MKKPNERWKTLARLGVLTALSLALGSRFVFAQSLPPIDYNNPAPAPAVDAPRQVIPGLPPPVEGAQPVPAAVSPEKHSKPQPAASKPAIDKHPITTDDKHPVVIAPAPLVPDTPPPADWVKKSEAAQTKPEPKARTADKTPIVGKVQQSGTASGKTQQSGTASAQQNAAFPAKPAQAPKTAAKTEPSKAAQAKPAKTSGKQGKPVVVFPKDVLPAPDNTSRRVALANRAPVQPARPGVYYPKGYKPYLPPPNLEQQRLQAEAVKHYNKANWYGQRDKIDLAIAEYGKAVIISPGFSDAYVGLSTAWMRKNEWENVLTYANKALALKKSFMDPMNILQAEYNLTAAYCATDEYDKAMRYFKDVKKANHPATVALQQYLNQNCRH